MSRYYDDELYHFGIKGMHWGVRRYQQKDGSLTSAGKKRYLDPKDAANIDSARKQLIGAKKTLETATNRNDWSTKSLKRIHDASVDVNYAKKQLSDNKTIAKMNASSRPKSKRQLSLEKEYEKEGLTKKEAELAAYKRARTEKILKTAAVVGVAAAGAYVGKKMYDQRVDKIIPKGTLIQNISSDSNKGVSDAFYGAFNKTDKEAYLGLYGGHLSKFGNVYNTNIKVSDDMKVASPKNARKILSDLVENDKGFTDRTYNTLMEAAKHDPLPRRAKLKAQAAQDFKNGKVTKRAYDAFNISLVYHTQENQKNIDAFYSKLKSAGYSAVKDVNDSKYSGYNTKNPMIFIDSGKLSVNGSKRVSVNEITKAYNGHYRREGMKSLGKKSALASITVGSIVAKTRYSESTQNNQIVKKYRKEHPNSDLSYNEIVRMNDKKKFKGA